MTPAAELQSVVREYRGASGTPGQRVLDGISLSISPGESVAITGPSGCGKSTLLNLLGTLDRPDAGKVILFGEDVSALDETRLSALRAQRIGFIFQLHHLLPQCSALENVLVPVIALPQKPDQKEVTHRATELLTRVGLADHLHKRPAALSGGERQRVAVVRALINKPGLILADEPTGALDADNAAALTDLLAGLTKSEGASLVLVTHDPALAARMDRTLRLDRGAVK